MDNGKGNAKSGDYFLTLILTLKFFNTIFLNFLTLIFLTRYSETFLTLKFFYYLTVKYFIDDESCLNSIQENINEIGDLENDERIDEALARLKAKMAQPGAQAESE